MKYSSVSGTITPVVFFNRKSLRTLSVLCTRWWEESNPSQYLPFCDIGLSEMTGVPACSHMEFGIYSKLADQLGTELKTYFTTGTYL